MGVYSNNEASPMSEEFHDWLDQCPVAWNRLEVTDEDVIYSFDIDTEEE